MKETGPEKREKTLVLNRSWCKGCGICVAFCPPGALALDDDEKVILVRQDACTLCGLCELRCPDFAVTLVPRAARHAGTAADEGKEEGGGV